MLGSIRVRNHHNFMKDNNDIFNTIADQAKKVALSDKEKATLFRAVDSYVRKHPVKGAVVAPRPERAPSRAVPSRWVMYFGANHSAAISFALVVFIVLGAGTSSAAQRALPGDLLYAVKTGINEQLHSLFLSGVNKTNYEATRAVERVKEAQTLADQGKLTDAVSAQLSADFDVHTAQVQKDVEELKQKGELTKVLTVADHFETALQEQSSVAPTPGTLSNEEAEPVVLAGSLAEKVQATIQNNAGVRTQAENSLVASGAQTNDLRKIAEEKHAAVLALVATLPQLTVSKQATQVTQATQATLKAGLIGDTMLQIKSLISNGDDALAAGRYTEALEFYRLAHNAALKAKDTLTAATSTPR